MHLIHLSIYLCLSLGFIHTLTHQHVHQKHWLLLNTLRRYLLSRTRATSSTMMRRSTSLLSIWVIKSLWALFLNSWICSMWFITILSLLMITISKITWGCSLSWLITIVNDKSGFINIQMSWGCGIIKICSTFSIRNSCINHIGWVLESLFNLLLVLLIIKIVLHILLVWYLVLTLLLLILFLKNHHVVHVRIWGLSFNLLHLFVFW